MKKSPTLRIAATAATAALLVVAAGCRKYDGSEARGEREAWAASLQDSIRNVSDKYKADSLALIKARENVAEEIGKFTTVENPREVEPYYILTSWKGRYPLQTTGLAARIMRNEGLELVAASRSRFSAIRVCASGRCVESEIVPPDQALNYTAGGLTTVAFTGEKADSIAMLVAGAADGAVKVEYLNPGVTATYAMPADVRAMIADTWTLCNAQRETHRLEKALSIGSRKIEILRLTLQKENEKHNQ